MIIPRCIWVGLSTWLIAVSLHSLIAQDTPQSESKLKLPKNAVWRFGSVGDTRSPGYYRLKFSPNGKFLAARSRQKIVEVWDCETELPVCELGGFDTSVDWLDFAQDSEFLLTASSGANHIKIWSLPDGKLAKTIDCNVQHARFSADGSRVVVLEKQRLGNRNKGSVNYRILEYGWPNGQFIRHRDLGKRDQFLNGISYDNRYLLSTQKTNNRIVLTKLYDSVNRTSVILQGPPESPDQVVFSRNDNWVATTYSRKDSVRIWNVNDPAGQKHELRGHKETVKSVAFSYDSRFLVTAGWDKKVVIWDLVTREPLGALEGHNEHIVAADFRPLSYQVATGATGLKDSTVILWDFENLLFPQKSTHISVRDFPNAWRKLGNSNPKLALQQVNNISNSYGAVANLLKKHLTRPMSVSREQILGWIGQLNSNRFAERELATQKLKQSRGPAELLLLESLNDEISTETQFRINDVLRHPVARPIVNVAEMRRIHRGIFILELVCRQPDFRESAIELLTLISQGHPYPEICRDAADAINRIEFGGELTGN